MATFHPCENTLTEYSAGNLDWAVALCVSAHLEFCVECRKRVSELNTLGGNMLVEQKPAPLDNSEAFKALMKRIHASQTLGEQTSVSSDIKQQSSSNDSRGNHLPKVVKKLLPKGRLSWKTVSPSLKEANLVTGQDKYQVSFHKIRRGGKVPEHDHRGLEVTLVLEGCFSDEKGTYSVGDYVMKEPGDCHRPMATQNGDCLCLSVVAAPVKLTGLKGALLNPFLTVRPA